LGPDGGDNEGDGELIGETDEMAFECGARFVVDVYKNILQNITPKLTSFQKHLFFRSSIFVTWLFYREKHAMLFDEPIPIHASSWYVAWARISGPSSDCGSTGQSVVTTEDQ
jgi:E3 ubiquitin-protein ligase MYCBP2